MARNQNYLISRNQNRNRFMADKSYEESSEADVCANRM